MEERKETYFSRNLKYLRKQSNLTQDALAAKLKIKRNKIVSYEMGQGEPSLELLSQIARFFNMSIDQIVAVDLRKQLERKGVSKSHEEKKWFQFLEDYEYTLSKASEFLQGIKAYNDLFKRKEYNLIKLNHPGFKKEYLDLLSEMIDQNHRFLAILIPKKSFTNR